MEKRRKPTIESHLKHYDKVMELLSQEINEKTQEKITKIIKQMKKEVPLLKYKKHSKLVVSGLKVKSLISDELCIFLQLPIETKISRMEVFNAICVYSHIKENESRENMLKWEYLNPKKRNLQNPRDKRSIIPDKSLSKLLRYSDYKKQVLDNKITKNIKNKETGEKETIIVNSDFLYYWVIQKLLSFHFIKI